MLTDYPSPSPRSPYLFLPGMIACVVLFIVLSNDAAAATATGTAFDAPLTTLRNVFTGPIAYTAALIGIVVAGGTLIFGGEIGEFAKRLIMLILVIAVIVLASSILANFFSVGGAVVAP